MIHLRAKPQPPSPHPDDPSTPKSKSGHFILCLNKSLVPPRILRRKSRFPCGPCSGLNVPSQPWQPRPCHVVLISICLHLLYPLSRALLLPLSCLENSSSTLRTWLRGLAPEAVRSSHSQGTVTPGVPLFPHGLVPRAERLVPSVSQARVWHTVGAQHIFAE